MHWTKMAPAASLAVFLSCAPSPAKAEGSAFLGEQLVDVMNQLFGQHPGLHSMHAKGLVVEGGFTPRGAGAALSKAACSRAHPRP